MLWFFNAWQNNVNVYAPVFLSVTPNTREGLPVITLSHVGKGLAGLR